MARWFHDRHAQQGIPSVSLRRLLPDAQFIGCDDFEVSGCTADSRRLDPGQVFVAVRGQRHDGHDFVPQALEHGAAGVVVETPCPAAGRLQVVVPDSRAAYARLCQALAGDPSASLRLFGVTGSAGATVTATFLQAILEAAGGRYGLLTRQGCTDGRRTRPIGAAADTAPGLAGLLSEMVEAGASGGVLELSHETLQRRRIEGVEFDAAVVTDLGGSPALNEEEVRTRRNAAARLVRQVTPGGVVIVNADEPEAELLGAVNLRADRVTFGLRRSADISAFVEQLDPKESVIRIRGCGKETRVRLNVPGITTVGHALAAVAVAKGLGIDLGTIVSGLESVRSVSGRLEAIEAGQSFDIRIDSARQGTELHDALLSLRSTLPARAQIHCVFGAEGTRPRGRQERLSLSAVAEAAADRVTLTTDNPRTEEPQSIINDLLDGFCSPGRVRVIPDREEAIARALAEALPGDAVLISGKGRQTFQIYSDRALPFDDADVVLSLLTNAGSKRSRRSA